MVRRVTSGVVLTDTAREVVAEVRAQRPGDLVLVIGNGCCDSTAAFLFADYVAGPAEKLIGEVDGLQVYADEVVFNSLNGTEIVIDAVKDPSQDSFSCEAELGYRLKLDRLPAA